MSAVTLFFSTLENASENVTSPGTLIFLKAQPKEEHFYQWNFRILMEKACIERVVGPLSVCGTVRNRSSEYNLLWLVGDSWIQGLEYRQKEEAASVSENLCCGHN